MANLFYYRWFNDFIQVFVIVARGSVVSVIIDPRPRFVFQYWINTTSERKLFYHVRSLYDEIKRRHRILAVTAARILSFCKLILNRNVIKHWTLTLSRLTVITADKNHYSVLGIHIDITQTATPFTSTIWYTYTHAYNTFIDCLRNVELVQCETQLNNYANTDLLARLDGRMRLRGFILRNIVRDIYDHHAIYWRDQDTIYIDYLRRKSGVKISKPV